MVSSTVDGSIAHVRGYVKAYMMGHIETAQELISSYGDRYAETMLAALTVKSQSAPSALSGMLQPSHSLFAGQAECCLAAVFYLRLNVPARTPASGSGSS